MTKEQIDMLWSKALHESVQAGEQFTRYHFAELVAAHEREECAKVCEETSDSGFIFAAEIRGRK